jgi:hypothetical protein
MRYASWQMVYGKWLMGKHKAYLFAKNAFGASSETQNLKSSIKKL